MACGGDELTPQRLHAESRSPDSIQSEIKPEQTVKTDCSGT